MTLIYRKLAELIEWSKTNENGVHWVYAMICLALGFVIGVALFRVFF